ncbi:hypothetical protein R1sor_003524 [Riccia sorocarpa]|uniref:Reverse transcriptase domain-containing protein n=1 Tax=Riccia sorocarpa TaxID=122646 RepID=A0ABD3H1V2_9MARC
MKKDQEHLQGLKTGVNNSLLLNLYADDTAAMIYVDEQNFSQLMAAIKIYERIAWTALNVHKSVIVPWGMKNCPPWVGRTGCKVAQKGEAIRYLGVPIGWGLTEAAEQDYIVGKLLKKSKNCGSFDLKAFQDTSRALRMKLCLQIYENPNLNWVKAAADIISSSLNSRRWLRERRTWSLQDLLLVFPPKRVTNMPTVQGLLDIWESVRRHLSVDKSDCQIQGETTPTLWVLLGQWHGWFSTEEAQELLATLKKYQIVQIGQWADSSQAETLPRSHTKQIAETIL